MYNYMMLIGRLTDKIEVVKEGTKINAMLEVERPQNKEEKFLFKVEFNGNHLVDFITTNKSKNNPIVITGIVDIDSDKNPMLIASRIVEVK